MIETQPLFKGVLLDGGLAHHALNHRWGYRSFPSSLALRDFLYLSWDLMMMTFLPTFKLVFFSSFFLDLCFPASSVIRTQCSQ